MTPPPACHRAQFLEDEEVTTDSASLQMRRRKSENDQPSRLHTRDAVLTVYVLVCSTAVSDSNSILLWCKNRAQGDGFAHSFSLSTAEEVDHTLNCNLKVLM